MFMKLKPSHIILLWENFIWEYKRSMDTSHLLIENQYTSSRFIVLSIQCGEDLRNFDQF